MHHIVIAAAVVTVAVMSNRVARTGEDECKAAIVGYNSALEDVSTAMK